MIREVAIALTALEWLLLQKYTDYSCGQLDLGLLSGKLTEWTLKMAL
ncbi:hypothetical protein [Leptodesmis sp.]